MRPAACATAHRPPPTNKMRERFPCTLPRCPTPASWPFRPGIATPHHAAGRGMEDGETKIVQNTAAPDAKTQRCRRHACWRGAHWPAQRTAAGPTEQIPSTPNTFWGGTPNLYSANPCLFGIHQPWKGRMLEANPLGTGPLFFVRPSRVVFALFRTADKPDQRPAT